MASLQFGHLILKIVEPGHLCYRICRDIPSHNFPPYVAPSEHSEYYEEEYDFAEYTQSQCLRALRYFRK